MNSKKTDQLKYNKLIEQGLKEFDKNNLEEGLKFYEQAFEIGFRLQNVIEAVYAYFNLKQYFKAEILLNKVSSCHDDIIYLAYGQLYEDTKRVDQAIESYKKIKDQRIVNDITYNLGYLYVMKAEANGEDFDGENMQKAVYYYEKFSSMHKKNALAHTELGIIYEHFNYNEKALKHFTAVYDIDNKDYLACYNLGVVYDKLNDYDASFKYYFKSLEINDSYPNTYLNLGIKYKDQYHDYEKAKQYYLLGLEKAPEAYDLWYNLGCIYALLKDYENAYQCFKYLYYKKIEYMDLIKDDEELQDFIKTDYYQKLKV